MIDNREFVTRYLSGGAPFGAIFTRDGIRAALLSASLKIAPPSLPALRCDVQIRS
jgi:hypothetical protein